MCVLMHEPRLLRDRAQASELGRFLNKERTSTERYNPKNAVAGPKIAHLVKITLAFEFSVLTLTVPGLRAENFKILKCFRVSAPFSFSLTAVFRIILRLGSQHPLKLL
jgi:hypothetical protein